MNITKLSELKQQKEDYFDPKDPWNQTHSGIRFTPTNPNLEMINLEDIAHALSMTCRFNGHTHQFYSNAQHSVGVSYLSDEKDQLHGLLHDASEAYLVDLPSPLKRTPEFNFYKKLENNLQSLIYKKFGLSEEEPASVKKADLLMLATEARDLISPRPDWILPTIPLPFKIVPLPPGEAKSLFLERFNQLKNK